MNPFQISYLPRAAAHMLWAGMRSLGSLIVVLAALLPAAPLQAAPARQEPPAPDLPLAQPAMTEAERTLAADLSIDAAAGAAVNAADYALGSVGFPLEGPLVIDGALTGVHSAQTADFDLDGDLDVVATERETGRLIWYRNNGAADPGFEAHPIAQEQGAYMALAADMNRDGRSDIVLLVVVHVDSDDAPDDHIGYVRWYRNDGAAPVPNFAPRTLATGFSYPVHAQVGDIDGNGTPDLVVASSADDSVRWLANSGGSDPTFAPRYVVQGADSAVAVGLGDMDRDGDLDVVVASENDDRIVWHANDGGGNFTPNIVRTGNPTIDCVPETPELEACDWAKTVNVADLDGDGDLDIAYGLEDGNEVGWYQSNGQRPPQFTHHVLANDRTHVKFVTTGDIDRDGDADLFAASATDGTVAWYRNSGAASPDFAPHVLTASAPGARYVHLADLDGDGDQDVITVARGSGQLAWFRNRSSHRTVLYPPEAQRVVGASASMRHMRSGDLDGDGDADLVSVSERELIWYENNGAIPAQFTPRVLGSTLAGGRWVDLGDADGDGDLDIAAASTDTNVLFWYENNGARPPVFTERVMGAGFVQPRSVQFGDLDGDGDLDGYAAYDGGDNASAVSRVAWYENNGARPPSFTERVIDSQLGYARSAYAADMDNDGDLDVVAADQEYSAVYLYENRGGAPLQFFKREIATRELNGAQHVHAGDMDGDGDLDVLVASEFNNRVTLLENADGLGRSFTPHVVDDGAAKVHAVHAGDADGDGDLDLFAAIEGNNAIVFYQSNGQRPPQFTKRILYEQAFVAHSVSAEDVDGDGDLDVLATARESGHALLFENRGGQYRLRETAFSFGTNPEGTPLAVLALAATHLGRGGDATLEMASLEVRFEDGAGNLLSADQVAGRVRSLSAYADTNSNGAFDPGDRLLATQTHMDQAAGGRLLLPLTVNPPAVATGPGGSAGILAVAELVSVCGTGGLRLAVRPTSRTAVDGLAGSALLPEGAAALSGNITVAPVDIQRYLRINEIAANIVNGGEEGDDWIEIYNSGPYTVDMGGMYLTDDLEEPTKHRIPDGITIQPYGYLVFYADDTNGANHLRFKLSAGGEDVGLFDTDARLNRVLDSITYGAQAANQTSGRSPDGGRRWRNLAEPTLGSPNVLAGLDRDYFLPAINKGFGC